MLPIECCCCPKCVNGLLLGAENFTEKTGQSNNSHTFSSPEITTVPSEFSGTMAKVAQHVMGVKGSAPFNPSWAITHGIYINNKDSENPEPWVIQISSDGVLAKLLPVCDYEYDASEAEGTDMEVILGGTPKRIPSNYFNTGWVSIANAATVTDFYSKSALFGKCGWAFNINGTAADNTCKSGEYFYHYRITITADAETGGPASASMALLDSGQPRYMKTIIPLWVPAGNGTLTDEMFTEDIDLPDNEETPVYVYYDGDDLKTLRFHNAELYSSEAVVDDVFISCASGGLLTSSDWRLGCGPPGTHTGYSGTRATWKEAGVYMDDESPPINDHVSGVERTLTATRHEERVLFFSGSTARLYHGWTWFDSVDRTIDGLSEYHTGCAAIPNGEREAVYTYRYKANLDHQTAYAEQGVPSYEGLQFTNYDPMWAWTDQFCQVSGGYKSGTCGAEPCVQPGGTTAGVDGANLHPAAAITPYLYEWNGEDEPSAITIECNVGPPVTIDGWCGTLAELMGSNIESVTASNTDEIIDQCHTHTLKLYRAERDTLEIFSDGECYVSQYGDDIKEPGWGNKWLTPAYTSKHLWALTDRISDLDLYSPDMDGGTLAGNNSDYPNTAGGVNAWVGIPG